MVVPSDAVWKKSTYSTAHNCVEVAFIGGRVAVRDSKDPRGAVLMFTTTEWRAFIDGVHDGEFKLA